MHVDYYRKIVKKSVQTEIMENNDGLKRTGERLMEDGWKG